MQTTFFLAYATEDRIFTFALDLLHQEILKKSFLLLSTELNQLFSLI